MAGAARRKQRKEGCGEFGNGPPIGPFLEQSLTRYLRLIFISVILLNLGTSNYYKQITIKFKHRQNGNLAYRKHENEMHYFSLGFAATLILSLVDIAAYIVSRRKSLKQPLLKPDQAERRLGPDRPLGQIGGAETPYNSF